MQLLPDVGGHHGIVAGLREAGHSVTYVAEAIPGASDEAVLKKVTDLGAVLVTSDKDFGELVLRQKPTHRGVIFLRLFGCALPEQVEVMLELLSSYGDKVEERFTVVDRQGFRFGRTPY